MKLALHVKIILLCLLVGITPLIVAGIFSYNNFGRLTMESIGKFSEFKDAAAEQANIELEKKGEEIIRQKAEDVAAQIEIYLHENPELTAEDLQKDSYFSGIAVQEVGLTGYTAVTDTGTLICRFHSNPSIVNMDLSRLATQLPGFWKLMNATRGGFPSHGYYEWIEADGSKRQKYMHIAIVKEKTKDNVTFSVASTTYIDEFSQAAKDMQEFASMSFSRLNNSLEEISKSYQSQLLVIFTVCTAVMVVVSSIFSRTLSSPLKKLTETVGQIGNPGSEMIVPDIKTNDEIETLSMATREMVSQLKSHKAEISKSQELLEKTVLARTKKLNSKLEELEKFRKLTTGRELKMIELKKKINELEKQLKEGQK